MENEIQECIACHGTGYQIDYLISLNSLDLDDPDYYAALENAPKCLVCK